MKFQTKPYIPPTINQPKIILTPEEKFEKLKNNELRLGNKHKFKSHHYKLISMSEKCVLFDGIGFRLGEFDSNIKGIRKARNLANNNFFNSKNQNGGFLFDLIGFLNPEYQSLEELETVQEQTRKHLDYIPFKVCQNCLLEFEVSDYQIHKCILGTNWMIILKQGETISFGGKRK